MMILIALLASAVAFWLGYMAHALVRTMRGHQHLRPWQVPNWEWGQGILGASGSKPTLLQTGNRYLLRCPDCSCWYLGEVDQ